MDEAVERALKNDKLIDITTTGRKTGKTYRKEVWLHYLDGKIYVAGSPGLRSWYANMRTNPEFTLHLKEGLQRDLPARATAVTDPTRRREVFSSLWDKEERMRHTPVEVRVERSALVEVQLLGQ